MNIRVSYKCGKAIDTKVKVERRSCPDERHEGTYGSRGKAPPNLKVGTTHCETRFEYVLISLN